MDVLGFIKMIYEWFCSLDIVDKIVGAIISFFTAGFIKKILERLRPTPEEKAFKQAVKRWQSSSYVRGYYKEHRLKHISEFCEYVIAHHGATYGECCKNDPEGVKHVVYVFKSGLKP